MTIVVALPRGGVPVAYQVAKRLRLPLDVLPVRKLGLPGRAEVAMGAIAAGGILYLDDRFIHSQNVSASAVSLEIERETAELERRQKMYRDVRPLRAVGNQRVILIDDGLATGATMRVAIQAVRQQGAAEVIVAVPVAPFASVHEIEGLVEKLVCLQTPVDFHAVSLWYQAFPQTTDEEVMELLQQKGPDEVGVFPPRWSRTLGRTSLDA